jgi:O-methyltransferase/methyltransferase family protein
VATRPSEVVLWDFLRGALMTRATAVAAELGVADALADSPKDVGRLAAEVGADPDTLERLLRALASDGMFEEVDVGVFANTEVSDLLRDPSLRALVHLFGGVYYRAVAELDAGGGQAFPSAFGTDFWSWLAAHPTERAAFDQAMVNSVRPRVERLGSLAWRGDEVVVDVGGGNGSLLVEFLRDRPDMRGVVFDRPETVRDEAALGERIDFVAGNFFDRVPEGDVYVLSAVLHDWDDGPAAAILRTIRTSAPQHARLVIVDDVLGPGAESAWRWADLHMLATLGGRERDESRWRRLLDAGGFEPVTIQDGLIEARPR